MKELKPLFDGGHFDGNWVTISYDGQDTISKRKDNLKLRLGCTDPEYTEGKFVDVSGFGSAVSRDLALRSPYYKNEKNK